MPGNPLTVAMIACARLQALELAAITVADATASTVVLTLPPLPHLILHEPAAAYTTASAET